MAHKIYLPPGDYREYYRISADHSGVQIGTDRQQDDMRPSIQDNPGVRIVGSYIDPDVSATKENVVRPEFERLLVDLRPGENILCWHSDRLLRKMSDLLRVIKTGSLVYSLHAGTVDLSTPAGVATAQTMTAWAGYEGKQKAIRQKSSHAQRAGMGKPFLGGYVPFGFDKVGGQLCVNKEQEAVLLQMYDMVLGGMTTSSIAKRLNESGSTTSVGPRGRPWTHNNVKNVLVAPRNAGIVVYNKKEMGRGNWTPIISETMLRTTVRMLSDPSRRTAGPREGRGGVKHALIGVVKCSVCDQLARGWVKGPPEGSKYRVYACPSGHASARAEWLENHAGHLLIKHVKEPIAEKLSQPPDVEALYARLTELKDQGAVYLDMLDAREMDRTEFNVVNRRNKAKIKVLEKEIKIAATDRALHSLLDVDDMEVYWLTADVKEKNAFVRAFFDSIIILPRGRGGEERRLPGHAQMWITGEDESWTF